MEPGQSKCQAELEAKGVIPRKYHGQVFTTDDAVIDQFIETVKTIYRPGTVIVEIGGGLGYITERLVQNFDQVDCLEIDDDLFGILTQKFDQKTDTTNDKSDDILNKNCIQKENILLNNKFIQIIDTLSNKNIIHEGLTASNKHEVEKLNNKIIQSYYSQNNCHSEHDRGTNNKIIQKNGLRLIHNDILEYEVPKQDYLLVGNIPFHLSGRLYRKFMSDLQHKPYGMVFITDKQYAKTLMGQPPRCYRVSLQAQAYGDIEIVADVPPTSVHPQPKVMCCIMKITHSPTVLPKKFWEVVNHHFENFPTPEVESPKTLALKDWIELAKKRAPTSL